MRATIIFLASVAWRISSVEGSCEICGCSNCLPVGSFSVGNEDAILDIPSEFEEEVGYTEIKCGLLELAGSMGLIPAEDCTDRLRLLPIFRETCGCPPAPTYAPTPTPTPSPVAETPPPTPELVSDETPAPTMAPVVFLPTRAPAAGAGYDETPLPTMAPIIVDPAPPACLELSGCYLENARTGSMRMLQTTDGYDIVADDSMWFWTVKCEYNPTPGAVTFVYPTSDGASEKVEVHEPFYMGADDEDDKPYGVNPFLSACGTKSFDVYAMSDGCTSTTTTYTLEAYCDKKMSPVSPPTMEPTISPCYATKKILAKAGTFLDAFKSKFAAKSDRRLKKKKDKKKKQAKAKAKDGTDDKHDSGKNDDKYHDEKSRPIDLSFDFVTGDDKDCELNFGAHIDIDTKILGIPIKLDGSVIISGIGLAEEDGKTLCVGGLHVAKYDVVGLSKFILGLLESQMNMDLPGFIDDILGDEICI